MKKVLLIFLASINVHATDGVSSSSTTLDPAVENTSEWSRMTKKVSAHYQIDGGTFTGRGIGLGYFISRNQVLQFNASRLSENFGESLSDILGSEVNVEGTAIEASYKHFFSNSFYLSGGLGYHEAKIERTYHGFIFPLDNPEYSILRGQTCGVTAALGNQWQVDNMTIGFNWLHFSFPVASKTSGEKASASDAESYEDRRNYYFKKTKAMASIYVGVSF